jgi:WD40 repeat protein
MSDLHQPEDVAAYNESSLKALVRAIRLSQGQFRLILVRCNYGALRDHMVQRLRELSPVKIRELVLPESVKTLYTTIKVELADEVPQALMVFGLESAIDLSAVLTSSNYIREEFSKSFPFPLILWVNDEVLQKLIRLTPDFESWATSVEFKLATDELLDFLRQKTDELFVSDSTPHLQNCFELEAAYKDLQGRGQGLEPDLEASLEFVRGLDDFANDKIDTALEHYQRSLAFWRQSNHLERRWILLLNMALSYSRKAEKNRANSREYWEESRYCLQESIRLFAKAKRPDLAAKYVSKLGEALRHLQAWEQLQILVEKSWKLHQKYSQPSQIAQHYGFLAEVALEQSRWREANQLAQQALKNLEKIPKDHFCDKAFYRLLLARSQQHLEQAQEAIKNLEQARLDLNAAAKKSNPHFDPQLYIDILGKLRSLYFQQGEYLNAFKIKQEKRSIEYQYGFQAFAGASHLQAKRQVISPTLAPTGQQAIIAQEIAASGREQFVNDLIKRLSRDDRKLTVIHGQSGVGKSSIIQAGFLPMLKQQAVGERDALPVVLRVYTDWVGMLGRCLAEALGEMVKLHSVDPPQPPLERGEQEGNSGGRSPFQGGLGGSLNSTIIEQLQINANRNLLTVLIFDQFEEFFFVYKEPAKRQQFYEFLNICLNIPFVKVILSLREDYLHYLLECNRLNHLDAINHNILDKDILCYLGNFSRDEAKVVIESLTKRSQFYLEPALIDELVKDLAVEFDSVRPIELQVVGAQLQENQITTLEKYRGLGDTPQEILVKQYLEGVIKDCGEENERITRLVLYWLTDENLTRPLKTRTELAKDLAAAGLKVKANKLDLVLAILVGSGLVVRVPESPDDRYQLVHDYLVAFIRQHQGAEVEELRKEVEFQRRRADEFQLGQSDALIRYSEALFNQGKKLEALIEGLRAGIPLKLVDRTKVDTDTWLRIVTVLRQEVYGVRESNCLEGHDAAVNSVSFSPDGKTIASASGDWTIKLWNSEGKLLQTLPGHDAAVNSVTFSPNGKTIASASLDGTIKLWNSEGKLLHNLQGHRVTVNSVSFSPDGKTIASANGDKTIKLWNSEGKLLHSLLGHDDAVYSVSFSPDGKTIASASRDKTIKLWNTEGKLLHILNGHDTVVNSVSFSPDGKAIASTSWDRSIKLWNTEGKLLHTLQGHHVAVNSVSFSPDGKTIASASGDGIIKLWNSEGELLDTLQGHHVAVNSISFSPNGKTIASASGDKTIKLWNSESKLLHTIQGHNHEVTSVSFSPDGKTIASASRDKTIKLWNTEGKLLHILNGHDTVVNSVSFSPDGKTIASTSWESIKLWNTEGKLLHTLQGHHYEVTSVSFSPDGKTIASASRDNTIKLWNTEGKLLHTLQGHHYEVTSVSFSPDGKIIASASRDKTIKLWNSEGKLLHTLQGHNYEVTSVSFSPDGKTIASASRDKTIKLWNSEGKLLHTLQGHNYGINSVSFSPDGKTIASASGDGIIKLWNSGGKFLHTLQGHDDIVNSVSFSPDGKTIASASRDKTIKLWNTEGKLLDTLQGHDDKVNSVSFSPDGKTIASASKDKTIKLWNSERKVLHTLQRHNYEITSVSFSPDGKTIVSASRDKTIKLWNTEGELLDILQRLNYWINSVSFSPDGKTIASASGNWIIQLWNSERKLLHTLQGHNYEVTNVSFSPNGKTIASASRDKTIKLWNIEGELLHTLRHYDVVNSLSFSFDGKTIASASRDKTIKLWNTEGKLLHTLQGHNYEVNSVSFSPDGKTIASASGDGIIKLWSSEGELLDTFQGHNYGINSVSFSPNSKTIASASEDKTIKLWNSEGKLLHTLKGHDAAVISVSFSPNGKTIASVSRDGKVILWNLDLDDLLVRGCNWMRDYLKNNPNVRESDRHLCDGIPTQK